MDTTPKSERTKRQAKIHELVKNARLTFPPSEWKVDEKALKEKEKNRRAQ